MGEAVENPSWPRTRGRCIWLHNELASGLDMEQVKYGLQRLSLRADVGLVTRLHSKVAEDELSLQRPKKIIENTPG